MINTSSSTIQIYTLFLECMPNRIVPFEVKKYKNQNKLWIKYVINRSLHAPFNINPAIIPQTLSFLNWAKAFGPIIGSRDETSVDMESGV